MEVTDHAAKSQQSGQFQQTQEVASCRVQISAKHLSYHVKRHTGQDVNDQSALKVIDANLPRIADDFLTLGVDVNGSKVDQDVNSENDIDDEVEDGDQVLVFERVRN